MKLRVFSIILCLCCLLGCIPIAHAAPITADAQDISHSTKISGKGFQSFDFLFDKDAEKYRTSADTATIILENEAGIGSVYLFFNLEYGAYTIEDNTNGKTYTAGQNNFLHEYIDLCTAFGYPPTSITLHFTSGNVRLSEIYVFSPGKAPDFVQQWDTPLDGCADMVLFSTHGDDDQLFFAGLLPYYAGELGIPVQVVYLTNHRNLTFERTHEILNGLWAVGVRNYPVMGDFIDFRRDDLALTYQIYESGGTTKDDIVSFIVEQIRRFKPQVAVGHDINGEYGHGMHLVYTDCLIDALELTNDADAYPDSAKKYGLWDIPKTYLHLYEENQIVMDYDQPLTAFNGMTAFEVSQKIGFPCHKSQQKTMFPEWIYGPNGEITKATQIETYNPCYFGLYRTSVGVDVEKNDFLENITTYAEQERLEQERLEQERLEQERLEQERLEQERLEKERLEQERLEKERLEQAQKAAAARNRNRKLIVSIALLVVLIVVFLLTVIHLLGNRRRSARRRKRRRRVLQK